jgi:hypothetical protein
MDVDTVNVMDVDHLDAKHEVNSALLRGEVEREGLLPHLDLLRTPTFVFHPSSSRRSRAPSPRPD